MKYWLLKSEPDVWSIDQQIKAGKKGAPWDGVRNYQAANNLKSMKKGDLCFFYHSNIGKEVVGIVKVIKEHSVSLLIHGHTHRPNTHEIATDNLSAKRIVLGDWDKHGWYIWMDSNSCELRKFSIF